MFKKFHLAFCTVLLVSAMAFMACSNTPEPEATVAPGPDPAPATAPARYLYVAAGLCYSGGGNTTFTSATASNLVYRLNTEDARKETIADYNSSPAKQGDSPVGLASIDSSSFYVLVENATAGARRIERVAKTAEGVRETFSNDTVALSTILRDLHLLPGGDLLISKGTSIEKISSSNVRITKGTAAYVNAPGSPCATSTTLMSKVGTLKNQFIVFLHAATSQNRFGFVKPSGYATSGDCSPAQAAPTAAAFPVAMAYDEANSKLLVAYAGNTTTTDINSIYAYNLTETATSVSIGAANKIYDASEYAISYPYLLYGISAMVLDPKDNTLYIATAINTATAVINYAIEKFNYKPELIGVANTAVLSRVGQKPFYEYGFDTKCISDMIVAD